VISSLTSFISGVRMIYESTLKVIWISYEKSIMRLIMIARVVLKSLMLFYLFYVILMSFQLSFSSDIISSIMSGVAQISPRILF
jgi:hypothetical protein